MIRQETLVLREVLSRTYAAHLTLNGRQAGITVGVLYPEAAMDIRVAGRSITMPTVDQREDSAVLARILDTMPKKIDTRAGVIARARFTHDSGRHGPESEFVISRDLARRIGPIWETVVTGTVDITALKGASKTCFLDTATAVFLNDMGFQQSSSPAVRHSMSFTRRDPSARPQ